MAPWVVGTQEQAALSLSPQPVLQPPCASGECQADVNPSSWIKDLPWLPPANPALPLRPLGWLLLQPLSLSPSKPGAGLPGMEELLLCVLLANP